TLAFALPGTEGKGGIASSVLLGGKYLMASRALAERFAASFRKMSLVSVHTALSEAEAFRIFIKLLNDLLARKMKAI
ncbi:MAG: hypothetical protein FGF53_09705, partial [Candidatus Brockarchaeota archaeon]|nr:hypothetical protein [Candidatus Brockarchaeota archaeon]